jgi:hypothetical protein
VASPSTWVDAGRKLVAPGMQDCIEEVSHLRSLRKTETEIELMMRGPSGQVRQSCVVSRDGVVTAVWDLVPGCEGMLAFKNKEFVENGEKRARLLVHKQELEGMMKALADDVALELSVVDLKEMEEVFGSEKRVAFSM